MSLPSGQPAPAAIAAVEALRGIGATVAVAESLTGGMLAASLVDVPGASAVFRGGLVVYATDLKTTLGGVPASLLAERGPVDPQVALALAKGAVARCGADFGVATTGVAGPDPQDGKPVGLVYVAVSGPGGDEVLTLRLGSGGGQGAGPGGGRAAIRRATVDVALGRLARAVADTSSGYHR